MIHKAITSTALAYIVTDALGYYKTVPEVAIVTAGITLGVLMFWTWVEAKVGEMHDAG